MHARRPHKSAKGKAPARRHLRPETKMFIRQGLFGVAILTSIALVLTAIWYGTRVTSLTIADVAIVGGETVSHELVRARVDTALDGAYFHLIPKRFAWFYPQTGIVEEIKTIERIDHVLVTRESGTSLSVVYDEYVPFALWCAEDTLSPCFFVDRTGYAFTTAPILTGESFVRFTTLGTEPQLRETLAERNTLRDIEWFIDTLARELGLYVVSVELDLVGDVFYTLSGGGELKATLSEQKERVFANLQTILASDEFAHIEPGNFQYIDLRFGNKIFVNEELAAPEEGTASSSATSTDR